MSWLSAWVHSASLSEVLKVVAPVGTAAASVVTATAALSAAIIAYRGLSKWREEVIGKRRAELAEEVLADFYQARDFIKFARAPVMFLNEAATRLRREKETRKDTQKLDEYFVTAERLRKTDFLAQVLARRYRFIAYYGQQAEKLYEDLFGIWGKIAQSANMLGLFYPSSDLGPVSSDLVARVANLEKVIKAGENDEVAERVDEIVQTMEKICRPGIQAATK